MDLCIAKITKAEIVDGSEKLLKLTLELNNETRIVFSGIRKAYPVPRYCTISLLSWSPI